MFPDTVALQSTCTPSPHRLAWFTTAPAEIMHPCEITQPECTTAMGSIILPSIIFADGETCAFGETSETTRKGVSDLIFFIKASLTVGLPMATVILPYAAESLPISADVPITLMPLGGCFFCIVDKIYFVKAAHFGGNFKCHNAVNACPDN